MIRTPAIRTPRRRGVDEWLQPVAPAERLAALRIAVGAFVTVYLILNVGEVARLARQPIEQFEPIGLARLFGGPLPALVLWLGFAVVVAAGLLTTAGIGHRLAAPTFAVGILTWTTYHSSWGQLLHFEHLFTLHVVILAFSPAADVWALRRPANRRTGTLVGRRYGWPIRLMAIVTATTYVLSGLAKLRLSGTSWFDPATLTTHIAYSAARIDVLGGPTPPLARFVVGRDWLIVIMATAGLAVELGAPLALVGRRLRNLWVVGAIGFHLATAATMFVFFGYRGLGVALLPLFAVERLPALYRRKSRHHSRTVSWASTPRAPSRPHR